MIEVKEISGLKRGFPFKVSLILGRARTKAQSFYFFQSEDEFKIRVEVFPSDEFIDVYKRYREDLKRLKENKRLQREKINKKLINWMNA